MSQRQVAVTGMGVIASNGIGLDNFWNAIKSGVGGFNVIDNFDISTYTTQIAGCVRDFNPEDYFDSKAIRRLDRFVQFAIAAGRMAAEDAGFKADPETAHRCGAIIGSGIGGIATFEEQMAMLEKRGPRRVSPFLIPKMIVNMAAGEVSIDLGLQGPNFCVSTACASSTHAIGEAAYYIRSGRADVMFSGGTEAAITPLGFAGFCSIKALSTRNDSPMTASRPFDKTRDGFVMGEGAAVLVLEELEHAKKRGAKIYGLVTGYGANADAYHITQPRPDGSGASECLKLAIEDAGIDPAEIDYINAHGTSTPLNDAAETKAIKVALGEENARKVSISSSKSMTGHTLGAAGAIEAVVTLKAIEEGIVPPTINYETPDPECDLDYTPNKAKQRDIKHALSNSLGFGGHNATLAFSKYQG